MICEGQPIISELCDVDGSGELGNVTGEASDLDLRVFPSILIA